MYDNRADLTQITNERNFVGITTLYATRKMKHSFYPTLHKPAALYNVVSANLKRECSSDILIAVLTEQLPFIIRHNSSLRSGLGLPARARRTPVRGMRCWRKRSSLVRA